MTKEKQLDYLLSFLIDEHSRISNYDVQNDYEDKWRLYRALVNIREPKAISNDFLIVQDELLQSLISEKGITDINDLQPVRKNLYLWRGDITTLKVDAIANAANSGMLGCFVPSHACIDNAIHTFAGVQLRLDCAAIMDKQGQSEPTGKAKITAAYNLPSKYVLHTVGPIISRVVNDTDRQLLASCYRSCLELAEQNNIESVAFCCISTGEFHFPNQEAAEIAVDTVTNWLKKGQKVERVIFNVFKEQDQRIYESLLR
jgi:O-acetyl-ADP-ribose deacetylase (regulator of RNase III)